MRCFVLALLVVAGSISSSGAINLRNESGSRASNSSLNLASNSSLMTSFSQIHWNSTIPRGLWNNRLTSLVEHEIEMVKADPPKVNKVLYVFFAMVLGVCGVDRCFMGQVCLGVLKGCSLGGLLVWHLIDYFVCLANALSKSEDINLVGYHATFEKSSIGPAFYVALVLFIVQMVLQVMNGAKAKEQAALQAKVQEDLRDIAEAQANISRRHQSLAYIPTRLTMGLRGAGLVPERPTVPELIAAFDEMDKNGDGQLDREEIKEALKALGASDGVVDEMIKCADTDGDGKISKMEFIVNSTKTQ